MNASNIQPGTRPRALTEPAGAAVELPPSSSTCPTTASSPPPYRPMAAARSSSRASSHRAARAAGWSRHGGEEERFQRIRAIPVAGPMEVFWSKYRWYCEEPLCSTADAGHRRTPVPIRAIFPQPHQLQTQMPARRRRPPPLPDQADEPCLCEGPLTAYRVSVHVAALQVSSTGYS